MMIRKINNKFGIGIVFHTILLVIQTCCVFLCAQITTRFISTLTSVSYRQNIKSILSLLLIFVIQMIIEFIKNQYWTGYKEKIINKMECHTYNKYLNLSENIESESKFLVICEKDLVEIATFYLDIIPSTIQAAGGIFVYSVVLARQDGGTGVLILLLVLGLFQFLPPIITEKYLIKNYIQAGQEEEKVRQEVVLGISGIFTIKLLNLKKWFMERYLYKQSLFKKVGERAAGTSSVQTALSSGVSLIQQLGVLFLGLVGVMLGWFSLTVLIEGYVLSGTFYQYMAHIGSVKTKWSLSKAAKGRINELFRTKEGAFDLFSGLEWELPTKGIWLIKGENGAGKSTLFTLINGSSDVDCKISWQGAMLSRKNRMRRTSWCPQMYMQISFTFLEILQMIPKEIIDDTYMEHCINAFGVSRELMSKAFNTLSGGEQKKLMISLTLAKKSDILLLDEPEVSLDLEGAKILNDLLAEERRLVFIISHDDVFDPVISGEIQVEGGTINVAGR